VLDRILTAWLDEAVLVAGLIPAGLGPMPEWPHQWFFDGNEHVDPAKEAMALVARLNSHSTTLATEYAKQGRDWETELRQRAKEVALMNELGLTASAAQPAASTPEEQNDDEDSVDDARAYAA
jgi:capsid protein